MEAENGTRSGLSLPSSGLRSEEQLGLSGISREPEPDVSFVLRNILEVPEEQVEGYLRHLGDPLEGWGMELCGNCEDVVVKAKQIHQELLDAQKRFKEVKFQIISKIMSIHQGIKCGDRKAEVVIEGEGWVVPDNLQEPVGHFMDDEAEELPGQELELEQGDESAKDHSWFESSEKAYQQQDNSTGLCKTEVPAMAIAEDENMMEFDYHFKTEQQLSSSVTTGAQQSPEELFQCEICFQSEPSIRSTFRGKYHLNRHIETVHQRKLSSCPCCGSRMRSDCIKKHLKSCNKRKSKNKSGTEGPKELFRCEICFGSEPSIPATFKRKYLLKRHIQTVHQRKLSSCPRFGSSMRSDHIKRHLKSCRKSKS